MAVLGAGLIGRRHIELVTADPGCVLGAIVDPSPDAHALADSLGAPCYSAVEEMLDASRPDGVIVATPNRMHVGHGIACIAAGVPVLVEKPIAESVEEATRLVDAAESARVPLLVGQHRRYSPILTRAREVVRSGRLGRVVAVMGAAVFYKPDAYFDDGPWRRAPGGGPILVNMIHEIDDLRFLCGEIDSVDTAASNGVRGFAVEDTVAMTIRFAEGALGTFMLSDTAVSAHSWEQTSGEDERYPHYPDTDCYVVAGTQGALSIPTMRLRRHTGTPSWWTETEDTVVEVPRGNPLAAQLRHFADVVRGTADPLVAGRDALRSLRVTQAVASAAAIDCFSDGRKAAT